MRARPLARGAAGGPPPVPPSTRRASRVRAAGRALVVVLLTAVATAVASPALADPPGPTHFRSTIVEVSPPDGAELPELEILGGDAYLVVRAVPGSAVEVPGYEGEPYLRIEADGTVEVNERSPAHYLNDARYGEADVEVPPVADADAPPTWTVVADGGEYAWHDHRIHFMSPVLPPQVDTGADTVQPVMDWTVPLIVDGVEVEVEGTLAWVPGPAPAVPVGLLVLVLGVAVAVALLAPGLVAAGLVGGAVVAAAVGASKTVGWPAGADGEIALLILPAVTLALVLAGRVLGARRGPAVGLLVPAAGVPLVVWGVLLLGALTRPIVPGALPVPVVRVAVALVLAAGVAGVVAAVRAVLRLTALDPDAPPGDRDAPSNDPEPRPA